MYGRTQAQAETASTFVDAGFKLVGERRSGWGALRWVEFVHDDGRLLQVYDDGSYDITYTEGSAR